MLVWKLFSLLSLTTLHMRELTIAEAHLWFSTYNKASTRFKDARVAEQVSRSEYEEIKHNGDANAVIYGIPMGTNYDDYHQRASDAASSMNSSLTESEAINILWTGVDANTVTAYSNCLSAQVLQSRGLHMVVKGATASDLTILIRYVPQGLDPSPKAHMAAKRIGRRFAATTSQRRRIHSTRPSARQTALTCHEWHWFRRHGYLGTASFGSAAAAEADHYPLGTGLSGREQSKC